MNSPAWWRVACLSMALVSPSAGAAADGAPASPAAPASALERDLLVSGGSVKVDQPVAGDLIVLGGDVEVAAPVAGDVLAAGGSVRIEADVGRSVVSAAGSLLVDGKVARNVRAAGGQVVLGPRAEIGRNVAAAAGELEVRGPVLGGLQASAGHLLLDGPVSGDVVARADKAELGPGAHLAGSLQLGSDKPMLRSPQAVVAGGVRQLPRPQSDVRPADDRWGGFWPIGLIVVAWLLLFAFPKVVDGSSRSLARQPGRCLLYGAGWLVGAPVLLLVVFATVLGIPLGLLGLAIWLAGWPVAVAVAGIGAGDAVLARWFPVHAGRRVPRVAAAAGCLAALSLLQVIPPLGGALVLLAAIGGMGSLLVQVFRRSEVPPAMPTPLAPAT